MTSGGPWEALGGVKEGTILLRFTISTTTSTTTTTTTTTNITTAAAAAHMGPCAPGMAEYQQ